MKEWCNCNSSWLHPWWHKYNSVWGYRQIIRGNGQCLSCQLYKWYDADYENMMYDLKHMNS